MKPQGTAHRRMRGHPNRKGPQPHENMDTRARSPKVYRIHSMPQTNRMLEDDDAFHARHRRMTSPCPTLMRGHIRAMTRIL